MTRRRRTLQIVMSSMVLVVFVMLGLRWLSPRPTDLGPVDGQLRACPDTPNCVCSFDSAEQHGIAPLPAGNDPAATFDRLRQILASTPRATIVRDDGHYLHAEYTTPLMRFIDDVEFLLDTDAGVIHVRSASRVGHSDLGANRQRIEDLRRQLASS